MALLSRLGCPALALVVAGCGGKVDAHRGAEIGGQAAPTQVGGISAGGSSAGGVSIGGDGAWGGDLVMGGLRPGGAAGSGMAAATGGSAAYGGVDAGGSESGGGVTGGGQPITAGSESATGSIDPGGHAGDSSWGGSAGGSASGASGALAGSAGSPALGGSAGSPATGGSAGDGGAPELFCAPGTATSCYSGPPNTLGVGRCVAGEQLCLDDGTDYGPCTGDVTPTSEDCVTALDDDCDGHVNELDAGCVCEPGTEEPCYDGPAATEDVGSCHAGLQQCLADGSGWGSCENQILPLDETCLTYEDDDCDGARNEEGEGCVCTPGEVDVFCYTGDNFEDTLNPPCQTGTSTCNQMGTDWGPCEGEVLPQEEEICGNDVDENCDGWLNGGYEGGIGCLCGALDTAPCYPGPEGTEGVGICHGGISYCAEDGTSFSESCDYEQLPGLENCAMPQDEDCDGQVAPSCLEQDVVVPMDPPVWNRVGMGSIGDDVALWGSDIEWIGDDSLAVSGWPVTRYDLDSGAVWMHGTSLEMRDASDAGVVLASDSTPLRIDGVEIVSERSGQLLRLDADGEYAWHLSGSGWEDVQASIGPDGTVVVGANFHWAAQIGETSLTGLDGNTNLFLAGIGPDGGVRWLNHYGAAHASTGLLKAIQIDDAGSATVLLNSPYVFNYGAGALPVPWSRHTLLKLDASGNLLWHAPVGEQADETSASASYEFDVTPGGRAIVSGVYKDQLGIGTNWSSSAYPDRIVAAFSPDSGAPLGGLVYWASSGIPRLLATASDGSVYTGYYANHFDAGFAPQWTGIPGMPGPAWGIVLKISNALAPEWQYVEDAYVYGIAVDASQRVIVLYHNSDTDTAYLKRLVEP